MLELKRSAAGLPLPQSPREMLVLALTAENVITYRGGGGCSEQGLTDIGDAFYQADPEWVLRLSQ